MENYRSALVVDGLDQAKRDTFPDGPFSDQPDFLLAHFVRHTFVISIDSQHNLNPESSQSKTT